MKPSIETLSNSSTAVITTTLTNNDLSASLDSTTSDIQTNTSKPKSPPVLVISLDADGCVYHKKAVKNLRYCKDLEEKQALYIKKTSGLIEFILQQAQSKPYKKIILMVGSMKQSKKFDDDNGGTRFVLGAGLFSTGSFFITLLKLAEELKLKLPEMTIEVDPVLISDLQGNQNRGANFNASVNSNNEFEFSKCIFDASKLALITLQMQIKSWDEKDANIDFNFIDDRENILAELIKIYQIRDFLVPEGVTPTFYSYSGKKVELYQSTSPIVGTGVRGGDYKEKLFHLLKCANVDLNIDPEAEIRLAESDIFRDEKKVEELKAGFISIQSNLEQKSPTACPKASLLSIFRPETPVEEGASSSLKLGS